MLLRQLKSGDGDARVEMGLRGMRGQSHCLPEEKGAVESERRRFMGQVTGRVHPGEDGDGDGMSRFSGGLVDGCCHRVSGLHLTLDSDSRPVVHSCAVMAILLGRDCYQRCRARQRPKWLVSASFGASRGLPSI